MFFVGFDHLNVLFMLIMAVFSFRAYYYQTIAVEEETENEANNQKNLNYSTLPNQPQAIDNEKISCQTLENSQNTVQKLPEPTQLVIQQIFIDTQKREIENQKIGLQTITDERVDFNNEINFQQKTQILNEMRDLIEKIESKEEQQSTCMMKNQNNFLKEKREEEAFGGCSQEISIRSSSEISSDLFHNEKQEQNRFGKRKRILKSRKNQKKIGHREEKNLTICETFQLTSIHQV